MSELNVPKVWNQATEAYEDSLVIDPEACEAKRGKVLMFGKDATARVVTIPAIPHTPHIGEWGPNNIRNIRADETPDGLTYNI